MSSKKRKSYYSNTIPHKRKKLYLQSGMKGFFCTCNGKEKECIREALNLLEEYSPKSSEEFERTGEKDIECELRKEIEELRSYTAETRPFQVVETEVKSCVFIKTTVNNPVELAGFIFKEIVEKKKCKSKSLIRLLPIEITCKANINDIKKVADEIFDFHFKCEATTYAVMYNHRCNNSVLREEVIESICILVRDRNINHRVDIKNPKKAIIIEIIKGICCLSVVPNFYDFKKYNLVKSACEEQSPGDVIVEQKNNSKCCESNTNNSVKTNETLIAEVKDTDCLECEDKNNGSVINIQKSKDGAPEV